jgi:hypothetical protein
MTPLQDKLRAALRETADEIPDDPPPLRLSPRHRSRSWLGGPCARPGRRVWSTWAAPLASGIVVVALVAVSLAIATAVQHQHSRTSPAQAGSGAVPPYYVAIVTGKGEPDEDDSAGVAAEVRATTTGAVLARIVPPEPYATFTGVTAAAGDRTFVLSAEEKFQPPASPQQDAREYPFGGYTPRARFFLLRIDPGGPVGGRASLQPLPVGLIPATDAVHDMALSPDGTLLAADIGGLLFSSHLFVFNLTTGTERMWSFTTCSHCFPSSGGLGFGGVNVDALSWAADGRQLAFIGPGTSSHGEAVRLLDVSAPGTNLLSDSKPELSLPGGTNSPGPVWRGAIITPDGRTIVVIEELAATRPNGRGLTVREQLAKFSAATGRATAILNNLPVIGLYEQVLYPNSTGNVLVVSYARTGMSAGILRGDAYTPIPWTPQTCTAAW